MTLSARLPMPGTCSARLARHRDFVAGYIDMENRPVVLAEEDDDAPMSSWRQLVMDVHKVAAPAPYVGDEFRYTWRVAMAPSGEWIAGDEVRTWRPPPTVEQMIARARA